MFSIKKHRVQLLMLAVILVAALAVGACGGGGNTPAPEPAPAPAPAPAPETGGSDPVVDLGDPVDLKLGHLFPITDFRGESMQHFADLCAEYSDGNINITVFPANTLTTSQDALKSTASGIADIAMGALSFNVGEVPALAPLDLAGIYDPDYFWETYEVIKPVLDKIFATQNQRNLLVFDEQHSCFYVNSRNAREVHSPADIQGLRLRDHGMWIGKSIANWGASPQTVTPADIAVALDRGTVDGGYTGWSFLTAYNLTESVPYLSFTKLSKSCWSPMNINLDVWNSLSPAQQEIMLRAAADAMEYGKAITPVEDGLIQAAEAAGGYYYYLTKEENQAFVDLSMNLLDECREYSGELGNELIDALLSAPSNYR